MSAFNNYIDRLKTYRELKPLLTTRSKSATMNQILELFKEELAQEVQQTIEPYIIKGDKVVASKRLTYNVNGLEFKYAHQAIEYLKEVFAKASVGSKFNIEVGEEIRKYSLWRSEESRNVFMWNGFNYVCVEARNDYVLGAMPVQWKVGDRFIPNEVNIKTLVPLEDQ